MRQSNTVGVYLAKNVILQRLTDSRDYSIYTRDRPDFFLPTPSTVSQLNSANFGQLSCQ
jgi:hypothetical protein